MRLNRFAEVDVGDDLTVDDDERPALKKRARVIERPARAQNFRLLHVFEMNAEATPVAQRLAHRLRAMMQVHGHLTTAVTTQILRDVTTRGRPMKGIAGFVRSTVKGHNRVP